MIADHQNSAVHRIRSSLSIVISPIQYIVSLPINITNNIIGDFISQQTLLKDNTHLKAQLSILNAKLQKQFAIESENKQLRALLQSSAHIGRKVSEAQLLAVASNPFARQIILNKGSNDGVFVGQPVLDAHGIMGQVVQITLLTSRVMLITDTQSAIPVQISRNGIRAIAVGNSHLGLLTLAHVTDTTDIKTNDILITSGLGQKYPFGYPVGRVISVQHKPGEQFANILVKPSAYLNRSRLVLLVWPKEETSQWNI